MAKEEDGTSSSRRSSISSIGAGAGKIGIVAEGGEVEQHGERGGAVAVTAVTMSIPTVTAVAGETTAPMATATAGMPQHRVVPGTTCFLVAARVAALHVKKKNISD